MEVNFGAVAALSSLFNKSLISDIALLLLVDCFPFNVNELLADEQCLSIQHSIALTEKSKHRH